MPMISTPNRLGILFCFRIWYSRSIVRTVSNMLSWFFIAQVQVNSFICTFYVVFVSGYNELGEAHNLKYSSLCYTTVISSDTTGSIARILQFGGYERAE